MRLDSYLSRIVASCGVARELNVREVSRRVLAR